MHSVPSLLEPTASTAAPTEASSTTSTTTTTEENISASAPVNIQTNRVHPSNVLSISDSIPIDKDIQSEHSTTSPPMQQPAYYSSDAIAKILAERDGQNIQFIPCMCPITLSSMQQFSGTKSKATTTTTTTTTTPPSHSSETERAEMNPFY